MVAIDIVDFLVLSRPSPIRANCYMRTLFQAVGGAPVYPQCPRSRTEVVLRVVFTVACLPHASVSSIRTTRVPYASASPNPYYLVRGQTVGRRITGLIMRLTGYNISEPVHRLTRLSPRPPDGIAREAEKGPTARRRNATVAR